MCVGITTYNALRNSDARVGDVVAILGVGGLGHLGIQFAAKMGFKTIAIARGKDKEELVRKLGARQYIDSKSQNPVEGGSSIDSQDTLSFSVLSGARSLESAAEAFDLMMSGKARFRAVLTGH